MKQVGMNPHIKSMGGVKATPAAGIVGKGATPKPIEEQQTLKNQAPSVASFNEQGLLTTSKSDGSVVVAARSGVALETSPDGVKTLSLPEEESKFRLQGEKVEVSGGSAREAKLLTNSEGLTLVTYSDKDGNHVQVHPDSMTYEVMNKAQTVSQVFHPNGFQEVVALGNEKLSDGRTQYFEKRALFDDSGSLIDQQGFSNFRLEGRKISFALGTGTASRTLPRTLPGQSMEPNSPHAHPASVENSAPTALLADDSLLLVGTEQPSSQESARASAPMPLLMEGPALLGQETPSAKAGSAQSPDDAKIERRQRMDALRSVESGYFSDESLPEGSVLGDTPSGVIRRMDKDSIGFSLPTGDQFRSDGELVVALGDNPRAKNVRLVEEDGRTLIAYRDAQRNSYQFDVNTGDLEVGNPDGTLHQKLYADGRESIRATSVHTTEAGSVKTSSHELLIDSDGSIHQQTGFEDLKIGSKHLEYTLPNGTKTVRNLLLETKGKVAEPELKIAPGVAEGWGDVDDIAGGILGRSPSSQAHGPEEAQQPREPQAFPPTVSGVLREELPEGEIKTTLPSGLSFIDGEEPYALDVNGNRLEVLKREVPSQGGYILYTKGSDGIGYTIAPEHLDFIAEGRDGKVHQLVRGDGRILTAISDGENKHTHQFDTATMTYQGSPGVVADINTPGQLYVMDSPQNRVYELPHPYPVPPTPPEQGMPQQPGYGQMPPGAGQPPVEPSFWDKVKNWFGATPSSPTTGPAVGPQAGHPYSAGGAPNYLGGMPGSHYQYDPLAQQMRTIQTTTNVMNILSTVSIGASLLSTMAMPTMFYPFSGGYYGGYYC